MTLMQLKARLLDGFDGKARECRRNLFLKFEAFYQEFLVAGMPCEMWVDGSVLTEKACPEDVDVAVMLDADVPAILTTEQKLLVAKAQTSTWDGIDCFLFVRRPKSDSMFGDEWADPASHWHEQWGCEHGGQWLKGFAVMRLGETHVGLCINN